MTDWVTGLTAVVEPAVVLMIPVGVLLGIMVGAIPGLSATVGITLFLPFTFALDPLTGLVLLLGIYNGASYSGAIPAILIRTPGTPAAAATVLDGYPMTQKGLAGQALSVSLFASVAGGLIGGLLLALFAPPLADVALNFGSAQYFAVAILALTIIGSLGGHSVAKGFISAALGLLVVSVGYDSVSNYARFSFGNVQLSSGLELIPLLVGLFGVAEALLQIEKHAVASGRVPLGSFRISRSKLRSLTPGVFGGTGVGFFTGLLPGVGGDIGGFVAYNETRRFARDKSAFGQGDPRGVATAEAANNASNMGSLVPTLALGIPGNTQAAVMMGALLIHGLQPGPALFSGRPDLVYGSFVAMLLSFVVMLVLGLAGVRLWARMIQVPSQYLWPAVLVLSVVGSYAVRTNPFDVLVMAGAGVLGYFMAKASIPVAPFLIGVIVGPIAEENYRRAMITHDGSYSWMLEPLTFTLLALAVLSVVGSLWRSRRDRRRADAEAQGVSGGV
ncbi:tripartite tricarboxylate transporter permease [Blastococcus sp. HT6-30]|uniref:tripartite tricarboxylate transporter permease n=1 Tax=Blastococcus sp. HT6-30 TaxID=3144843 RepID=UPI00321A8154